MTDKAISPLRRRLIEDMTIRRLSPKTQYQYIRHVKKFADFLGRSADKATAKDVHRYHCRRTRWPSYGATWLASALSNSKSRRLRPAALSDCDPNVPTELWSTSAPVQLRCASRNADCETVLVVVVLDLHDVVAGTEGPAETLDAMLTPAG